VGAWAPKKTRRDSTSSRLRPWSRKRSNPNRGRRLLPARLPLLLLPASPPGAPGTLLPRVCRGPPLRVGGLDDEPRATPASSKPSASCGSGKKKTKRSHQACIVVFFQKKKKASM
jgi:hypothetical protein